MIKTDKNSPNSTFMHQTQRETSPKQLHNKYLNDIFQNSHPTLATQQQLQKCRLSNNIISLNSKEQVQSVNSSESVHSDDMDIDEQNDIVNELSYIQDIDKTDEEDEMFANLSAKDRILYANTKKHQGNEYFKENNLQEAIEAYKFGLSLLKPQSFAQASAKDCLLMAQLTSNILYNMGTCYFILMSYRYAIRFYDQAILIKPNYAKAIHNRALCHLEQGNLLAAYNDIRLAFNYDKQNVSIHNDLKKIEEEYFGVYGHQSLKKVGGSLEVEEKRIMSKSMVENNVSEFAVENSDDTAASTIKKQKKTRNNLDITKLAEEKPSEAKPNSQQILIKPPKQRVKSFYGKRFYRTQVPKTPKTTKPLNSSMNSPKFRPFILNRTLNSGSKLQPNEQQKKADKQKFQNSAGELFQRDKGIVLLQQKVEQSHNEPKQTSEVEKKKRKHSRQKRADNNKGDYWGYIPIFVATGYGLYHSLKAVLGK